MIFDMLRPTTGSTTLETNENVTIGLIEERLGIRGTQVLYKQYICTKYMAEERRVDIVQLEIQKNRLIWNAMTFKKVNNMI